MADISKVVIGGRAVVTSGSAVVLNGQEVEVVPHRIGPAPLRIRIVFVERPGVVHSIETQIAPENTVEVSVVNFSNPLGTALIDPLLVGNIGGRNIYLALAVWTIGSGPKMARALSYTVTAEGSQDV